MRDFVNTSTSSEAFKIFGGNDELINFMKEWERLAKDKTK